MVGPISDEDRGTFLRRAKLGFVLLVALSAGLVSLQADAGPVAFGASTLVGGGVGLGLARFVFPERSDLRRGGRRFR